MSLENGQYSQLTALLEALCEERLSTAQAARLEELVLASRQARQLYLEYIDLHGTLYWDTAIGGEEEFAEAVAWPAAIQPAVKTVVERAAPPAASPRSPVRSAPPDRSSVGRRLAGIAVAAALLIGLVFLVQRQIVAPPGGENIAGDSGSTEPDVVDSTGPDQKIGDNKIADNSDAERGDHVAVKDSHTPLPIDSINGGEGRRVAPAAVSDDVRAVTHNERPVAAPDPSTAIADNRPSPDDRAPGERAVVRADSPVRFINEQLAAGWSLAGVEPSPPASDSEWMRRVSLDITGRIPTPAAVEEFLNDQSPGKRSRLIDRLLDDTRYVANWTTIWTNLLIGRSDLPGDVSRPALERFLRRSFAHNRPWSEIVFDLVSAEGDNLDNGATNFLLAHLNNEAVPATAVTARLFLGTQVQCTQCHHHPFNDATQSQFWELNSCFQQTDKVRDRQADPQTGKTRTVTRLVNRPVDGPIFYENRQNVLLAAMPKFSGKSIDPGASTNRRLELARLMIEGEQTDVALAKVNRMWQHFFGYGFTNPVDDMGPHNPPTHPALLDQLARDFVASGYDVKQLIRWICNSDAYQLSSRYGDANGIDNPQTGESPLFSRMYVKSMTVEQLYDSLHVATRLNETRGSRWDESERARRHQWLQQFVVAYDTEENNESVTFDGTIPQALMLMNGELVQQALSAEGDTYLRRIVHGRLPETEKIRKLFLAALSRNPTPQELATLRKLINQRQAAARGPDARQQAQARALQDLFWAFLNSSEFILIH